MILIFLFYYFLLVVPHITDAIQEWVSRVASEPVSEDDKDNKPEVCIVELGGTIGDIEGMPFVEAFRQFQFRVKRENFCCVHVSLVPQVCVNIEHYFNFYLIEESLPHYRESLPK